MHTYKKSEPGLYTVGYYIVHSDSEGHWTEWVPLKDWPNESVAECHVNYLNGGKGELFIAPEV